QPENELHVGGERQRGVHALLQLPRVMRRAGDPTARGASTAVVEQVPYPVPEPQPTGLEVGLWTPWRARNAAAGTCTVGQARRGIEHVPHVLGIVLPIGGQV